MHSSRRTFAPLDCLSCFSGLFSLRSSAVSKQKITQAQTESVSYDKVPGSWKRPATWPPRKAVLKRSADPPHVVLSTKFQEPWYTVSIGIKEIFEELGCKVYNPNTDNQARSGGRLAGGPN